MGYSAKLLGADERIVINLRPHWKRLVAPIVVLLATSAAATYLALLVPERDWQPWARLAIGLVWLFLVVMWVLRPFLIWWYTQYTVTNKRFIMRTGVFSRSGEDIPLQRITDVSFERSWAERILGSGTLHVESASERGPLRLIDIPHVEDVQRDLNELAMLDDQERLSGEPERPTQVEGESGRPTDDERPDRG